MIFNNNGKPFSEAIKGVDKIIHTDCNRDREDLAKTARFHLITKEGISSIPLEQFEKLDSESVLRIDSHYQSDRYFGLDPEYVYDALLRAQK